MSGPDSPAGASPWRGQLADGQSAHLHEVGLTISGEQLVGRRASDGLELLRWPLAAIKSERLDDARAVLTCKASPDGALTVSADLLGTHLVVPRSLGPRTPRWKKALGYAGGIVAVVALIYVNLNPLARAIAQQVPPSYEAQLGHGLGEFLEKQYCESPADRVVLRRFADRLGGGAKELHVLDSEMVNAFTFPGGVVIITRGLIDEAQTSDEVAGVLAHELEHVRRRHIMTHFIRTSILTAMWQATMGDYTGLFVVDPKTAFDIATLRFSRDDEREADQGALARLDAARVSRAGFRDFFERMRAKTDMVPAWLSNHPASAERVAAIGQEVGAVPRTPALSADDWNQLKDACGKGE